MEWHGYLEEIEFTFELFISGHPNKFVVYLPDRPVLLKLIFFSKIQIWARFLVNKLFSDRRNGKKSAVAP